MDAGDPLRPARPAEGSEAPKPSEIQDDGYETSNSGERPKPSSAEASPAPQPPPTPPAQEQEPSPQEELDLMRHYPYPQPPQHQPQHQPPPQMDQYPPYGYPYPQFKRETEYDMQYKREEEQQLYNGVKRECDDPYSFVEEDAMCAMLGGPQQQLGGHMPPPRLEHTPPHLLHQHHMMLQQPKKRGRKKKVKDENGMEIKLEPGMEGAIMPRPVKERKKHDRFNGMSEEEVSRRTLPDHLTENLDIIIIGINPGLFAAYKGHHYAGPGNHFWKCLYLSGLTREQMSADEDYKLLNFGIGFTNMVSRATKGSADLTRREIKEGSATLLKKLQTLRPKVAVFNGKLIYEVFSGKKDFCFGKQPDTVAGTNTYMWVMPSSSARCAQLPRAADKVPFYAALKKFRDYLNGLVAGVDDAELVFPDTTSRRPQDELEIRRLTQEPEPGDTIILEDGTEVPLKKKRGRPKKVKLENGEVAPPTPRQPRQPRAPAAPGPDGEPPKKKRGRPKKIRPEEQQFLLQQQAAQQQQQQQQAAQQQQQSQMLQPLPNMQQLQQHDQYMQQVGAVPTEQEGGFGNAGMGAEMSGGMMYTQQQQPDQPQYYSNPNQGAAMDGGGSMEAAAAGYHSPHSYIEPRRVYSPRQHQYAHSPAPAPAPTYSPRPAPAPQPLQQFPGSPGAPPRPASYGSPRLPPARSPLYLPQSFSPGGPGYSAPTPPGPSPAPPAPAYASPAYSAHSSPAPPAGHQPQYSPHPYTHQVNELSEPGAPCLPELPPTLSPTGGGGSGSPLPLDFEPPSPRSPRSPRTPRTPGQGVEHDDYNKSNSVGSEMSVGCSSAAGGYEDVYRRMREQRDDRYRDQGGQVGVGSPHVEQMHQQQQQQQQHMYNNYNRSPPSVGGSPFSAHAAFRPPDHTLQHPPGSPAPDYNQPKTKSQDVASKSLSGLESLVDQIPSIAEGPAGAGGGVVPGGGAVPAGVPGAGGAGEAAPAQVEYPPPLYPPSAYGAYQQASVAAYGNNGYGAPFVGYAGGWGGQLMRPTPAYLSEWQYAAAGYPYNTYNAPYYTPPPAHAHPHAQQYLPPPAALLDLHKQPDAHAHAAPGVPSVPSVPSVGFGGFC